MSVAVRWTRALGAMAVLGAVSLGGLTACGGSSSDGAAKESSGTVAEKDSSKEATATTKASGGSSGTTAKSSGGASSSDMAQGMVDAFNAVAKGDCSKAKAISDDLDGSMSSGGMSDMAALSNALQKVASSGPSEVKADLKTMADAFTKIADAYTKLGITDPSKLTSIASDPAKMAEFQKAAAAMEDPAVQAASDRIDAWVTKKCPNLNKS